MRRLRGRVGAVDRRRAFIALTMCAGSLLVSCGGSDSSQDPSSSGSSVRPEGPTSSSTTGLASITTHQVTECALAPNALVARVIGHEVVGVDHVPTDSPDEAPPVERGCEWRTAERDEHARLLLEVSDGGPETLDSWINRDVQARCRVEGGSRAVGDESYLFNCGRPAISVAAGGCVLRIAGIEGDDEAFLVEVAAAFIGASDSEPMCDASEG